MVVVDISTLPVFSQAHTKTMASCNLRVPSLRMRSQMLNGIFGELLSVGLHRIFGELLSFKLHRIFGELGFVCASSNLW